MDLLPFSTQILENSLLGAAFLVMLFYTFLQRRDNLKIVKQLIEMAEENAERLERISEKYSDNIKENTKVTVELTQYLKDLNGKSLSG